MRLQTYTSFLLVCFTAPTSLQHMPQVSPAFPFRPLFTLSPVRSPHSPILSQSKQGPLIKRMPYKSLCIQIRSRAWLGRRPWRQRVGLAFLMLHTRLSSASLLAWHVSLGPCTGSQCQDTALVPTIHSQQVPEGQAGHHPLGPTNSWLCRAKTQIDDPAGEKVLSPEDSLQDPMVRTGRRGGGAISPPKCWRIMLSQRCG